MDDNTKALIDELVSNSYDFGELNAKLQTLHNYVDKADKIITRSDNAELDTKLIRELFGWERCVPVGESHERLDE